jgi:hypothetical protein
VGVGVDGLPERVFAPIVFGVFSGQFGSDFWVTFPPERGEVSGDLDGTLAGGEHLNHQGDAVVGDA